MTASVRSKRTPRAFAAVALVVAVAMVASGCNSGAAWIARIDKQPIDSPNFWAGVPLYSELASGDQAPVPSDDRGIAPVSDAANYALFLVQKHALQTLNERNGTTVSEADRSAARQSMLAAPGGDAFKDLPSWFLDQIVEAQAQFEALIGHYAEGADLDAQVEAYYEANQDQFRQVCLGIISGDDESQLAQARSRIEEGTAFAVAAEAVASEQAPGPDGTPAVALGENADGDVGCVPVTTLVTLFADPSQTALLTEADPDALVGPVPVAGGAFMLFQVRSVEIASLEEARPTIEQQIGQPGAQQAQAALNDFLQTQDLELNPRLGSWVNGVGYNPPQGAEQPAGSEELPPGIAGALG